MPRNQNSLDIVTFTDDGKEEVEKRPLLHIYAVFMGIGYRIKCIREDFNRRLEVITQTPRDKLEVFLDNQEISNPLTEADLYNGMRIEIFLKTPKKKNVELADIQRKVRNRMVLSRFEIKYLNTLKKYYDLSKPVRWRDVITYPGHNLPSISDEQMLYFERKTAKFVDVDYEHPDFPHILRERTRDQVEWNIDTPSTSRGYGGNEVFINYGTLHNSPEDAATSGIDGENSGGDEVFIDYDSLQNSSEEGATSGMDVENSGDNEVFIDYDSLQNSSEDRATSGNDVEKDAEKLSSCSESETERKKVQVDWNLDYPSTSGCSGDNEVIIDYDTLQNLSDDRATSGIDGENSGVNEVVVTNEPTQNSSEYNGAFGSDLIDAEKISSCSESETERECIAVDENSSQENQFGFQRYASNSSGQSRKRAKSNRFTARCNDKKDQLSSFKRMRENLGDEDDSDSD